MGNKRLIIDKSREIFNRVGFKNASVRLVCNELGISPGSFSYHFSDKNQVINILYNEMQAEVEAVVGEFQNCKISIITYLDTHKNLFFIQEKYRFFYLNLFEIFENMPNIKQVFLVKTTMDRALATEMIKIYMDQNVLIKNISDKEMERLIDVGQILNNFWMMDAEIMRIEGKIKLIQYMKICCGLLVPYLESSSLKEYHSYFEELEHIN